MERPNNYPEWASVLLDFQPGDEREREERDMMLEMIRQDGERLLKRESRMAHFTASSIILSPDREKTLMVYHRIYQSWAWTGGHMDGETDFEAVARREAMEETGIAHLRSIGIGPASLEILPVWYHVKRGKPVGSHQHMNVSYLFEADPGEPIRCAPDENTGVAWIPVKELETRVSEPPMLPIYRRLIERANNW